ncbi:MAG TPA: hypothetical protein VMB48_02640 [Steroidobacteraceae bacterium]|nr:hypothetical protein [Steroidobacteraceae bacterium]
MTPAAELTELCRRIDAIERGYEYLLAYAAQGRRDDRGTETRARLLDMHAALEGLEQVLAGAFPAADPVPPAAPADPDPAAGAAGLNHLPDASPAAGTRRDAGAGSSLDSAPFLTATAEDARKARGAIAFVLNREAISSLLVDNLNASIHLRALLTDLFLVDQGFKSAGADGR